MDLNVTGPEQVWISHPMVLAAQSPTMRVVPITIGHALLASPARASCPLGPPQHATVVHANCTGKKRLKDCQNAMGTFRLDVERPLKKNGGKRHLPKPSLSFPLCLEMW